MKLRVFYNAPVILTYSLICTAVYLINSVQTGFHDTTGGVMFRLFSLSPDFDSTSVIDYFTLFSYTLGHANWEHLLGNLSFILLLGPVLEEKYGSRLLLFMIAFAALITAVFNILLFNSGLIGSSGVVFMFIILISFSNMKQAGIPLTFILVLLLYVGKEIISSFEEDSVSQFAHIMGGVVGSIFGFVISHRAGSQTNINIQQHIVKE